MTHNLAITRLPSEAVRGRHGYGSALEGARVGARGRYLIVGGTHRNRALSGHPKLVNGYHQGIWVANGARWEYDERSNLSLSHVDRNGYNVPAASQWRDKRLSC